MAFLLEFFGGLFEGSLGLIFCRRVFVRKLDYRIVLIVSWSTGIELRSINTQFSSNRREDRNCDFFGFFGGPHAGEKPLLCAVLAKQRGMFGGCLWC